MKKTVLRFVLLLSALSLKSVESISHSETCDPDSFVSICLPKLSNGFIFLKSYKVDVNHGKDYVEFSYVFTEGTQYSINLCTHESGEQAMIVSLYDRQRNKVGTSKVNGEKISTINYPCHSTGIYYIQYSFEGSSNKCGGSVLGFRR